MIDAVASGDLSGAEVGRRITEAEAEVSTLEEGLAAPDAIALHPRAVDYYLAAVNALAETLAMPNDQAAVRPIWELVDSIIVYP